MSAGRRASQESSYGYGCVGRFAGKCSGCGRVCVRRSGEDGHPWGQSALGAVGSFVHIPLIYNARITPIEGSYIAHLTLLWRSRERLANAQRNRAVGGARAGATARTLEDCPSPTEPIAAAIIAGSMSFFSQLQNEDDAGGGRGGVRGGRGTPGGGVGGSDRARIDELQR